MVRFSVGQTYVGWGAREGDRPRAGGSGDALRVAFLRVHKWTSRVWAKESTVRAERTKGD